LIGSGNSGFSSVYKTPENDFTPTNKKKYSYNNYMFGLQVKIKQVLCLSNLIVHFDISVKFLMIFVSHNLLNLTKCLEVFRSLILEVESAIFSKLFAFSI
jgi:hypothetical protein